MTINFPGSDAIYSVGRRTSQHNPCCSIIFTMGGYLCYTVPNTFQILCEYCGVRGALPNPETQRDLSYT